MVHHSSSLFILYFFIAGNNNYLSAITEYEKMAQVAGMPGNEYNDNVGYVAPWW